MQAHRDIVVIDTYRSKLPHAMQELYLSDLQGWVVDVCRNAVRTDPTTTKMLDALFGPRGVSAGLSRWEWIGPHAALRSAYRLSRDAVTILLLAAAPKLWGNLTYVYDALSLTSHGRADFGVLRRLLGDNIDLRRELAADAPLVAFGLVTVGPTGAVSVNSEALCRLAGH